MTHLSGIELADTPTDGFSRNQTADALIQPRRREVVIARKPHGHIKFDIHVGAVGTVRVCHRDQQLHPFSRAEMRFGRSNSNIQYGMHCGRAEQSENQIYLDKKSLRRR